jgi:hypothetical protein
MTNNKAEDDSSGVIIPDERAQFNLYLNNIDRFADAISIPGLMLSFNASDEVEEIIFREQAHDITPSVDAQMNYEVAKKLVNVNLTYLATVLLFYYTSSERLNLLYETLDLSKEFTQERIRGRELVTLGDIFKITGYTLAANGFEMIADSVLKEGQITPPP